MKSEKTGTEYVVADVVPPVIADKIMWMVLKSLPFNRRVNERNTLMLIRDEIDRALNHVAKDFVRRT